MRGNCYSNYIEINAKFDSTGKCGHQIRKGDRIGYNRQYGAQCADCWNRWASENAEADLYERQNSYESYY